MEYDFDFSKEENLILKETRKISFEDVIEAVKKGKILADLEHAGKKYSGQRLLIIQIKKYVYVVPYIINIKAKKIFLKTIYPSRKLTKKYLK